MESQGLPRDIILVVLICLRSYDKIDSLSLRKVLYLFQKVVHNVERFLDIVEICCEWLTF